MPNPPKQPVVLITGAQGRIGQILMARLSEYGRLIGLDRYGNNQAENLVLADVANRDQLEAALQQIPAPTHIIHLAGDPRVDADWQSVLLNNIHGTHNIYAAAQRIGVQRVVFASSNHVTGLYEGNPPTLHLQVDPRIVTVDDPTWPDSFYGISKLTGEAIARLYFDRYGLESACLRIGSVSAPPGLPGSARESSTWLSYRDLAHLVARALFATTNFPGFGIYYGVSDNRRRFWSLANARAELGYAPQDDAAEHWPGTGKGN